MIKARKSVVIAKTQGVATTADKAHLIEILGHVQGHLCVYNAGSGPTNFCDCKYAENPDNVGGPTEKGNGCPEVRRVINILTEMSDAEYKRISARIQKQNQSRLENSPLTSLWRTISPANESSSESYE
jgi:hypothetical protein